MANLLLAVLLLVQIPGAQTGSVEGRVLSMDGSPAAGLRVAAQVVSDDPAGVPNVLAAIVQTDSTGRYRLEALPAGRYYIAAGLVDFPTYYPGVTGIGEARTVAVTGGASLTGIDFKIARPQGLKVSGRVIREANASAPPNQRVLLSGGAGRPSQNIILGSDGSFEFTNLIPGNYTIGLSPQNGSQAQRIVVSDKDLHVELLAPVVFGVLGHLVVENNGARPRLGLLFEDRTTGLRTNAAISSAGAYSVLLPRGTYRVSTLQALQSGFSLKSMTSGNVDLLRESLTVAGEGTPEVVVTVGVSSPPPWVKVSGRVVGGTLTGRERINLTGAAAGEILEALVLPDGSFEFPKVLPGQYNGRIQSVATAAIAADPLTLVVGNTDINNWEVRLPATVDVSGRVIFEGPSIPTTPGNRSAAIRFTLTGTNGVRRSVGAVLQRDADSSFSLTLPEGSHRLSLEAPPAGYVVKSMTYGTANLLTSDVTIDPRMVRDLTIVLEPAATGSWVKVSGKVTGVASGTARVSLLGNAQNGVMEAITTPDGSFEFPNVWPGTYSARVYISASLAMSTATPLLVPSTGLTGVELKVPRYREAVGRLAIEGGEAVALLPRFWLTLETNSPASAVTAYPVLQPDASFRVLLPEGDWRVAVGGLPADLSLRSLTYGDVELQRSAVKFTPGDTQQLQVALGVSSAGLVRLSGRVIGPLRQSDTVRLTGIATAEARLAPDGTFEFPRVLPGSYSWGYAYGWTRIAVPNKDLTDLTIRSVRGRIVFEETVAQPASVYLQASDAGGASAASVQPNGSFVLIVAEGTYRLTMSTIPAGMYVKSIRYGDSDLANQMLTIAPGQETSDLQIVIGRRP